MDDTGSDPLLPWRFVLSRLPWLVWAASISPLLCAYVLSAAPAAYLLGMPETPEWWLTAFRTVYAPILSLREWTPIKEIFAVGMMLLAMLFRVDDK